MQHHLSSQSTHTQTNQLGQDSENVYSNRKLCWGGGTFETMHIKQATLINKLPETQNVHSGKTFVSNGWNIKGIKDFFLPLAPAAPLLPCSTIEPETLRLPEPCRGALEQVTELPYAQRTCPGHLSHSDTSPWMTVYACVKKSRVKTVIFPLKMNKVCFFIPLLSPLFLYSWVAEISASLSCFSGFRDPN